MSLADEARALQSKPGPRCHVGRLLATPLRDELLDALKADDVEAKALSKALRGMYAIEVSPQSIARHRREDCQCSLTTHV